MNTSVALKGIYNSIRSFWIKAQIHLTEDQSYEAFTQIKLALDAEKDLLKQFNEIDEILTLRYGNRVFTIVWDDGFQFNPNQETDDKPIAYLSLSSAKKEVEKHIESVLNNHSVEFVEIEGETMIPFKDKQYGTHIGFIVEYNLQF